MNEYDAYLLLKKWLKFAEDEHTFNNIEKHHITNESDTNATVISNEYEDKVNKLMDDTSKLIDDVCELCWGKNNHGTQCQNEAPF